jgi:MFS transporter, ACS family, glucarate transporter
LNDSSGSARPTRARYIVILFMVTLAMVTYLDRACIGTMKTTIQAEFGLSEGQFSWVFFSFIFAYALFEIPTARWAERRGTKNVFSRIVAWWSVFTLMTAASWNYVSLVVTRFLFGAGEAGAFPCMARVMSRWIPFKERGTAKGIFFAGAYASGAMTNVVVLALLPLFSWRVILVMFGLVGFVWVIAWHRWYRDDPAQHPSVNQAELDVIVADRPAAVDHPRGWPFWANLLKQRNVRLLCAQYMANCAAFYFCITWLASYLENEHHLKKSELGWIASLPLLLSIGTQFMGGFLSDKLTQRFGVTVGRRTPAIAGYSMAAVFITLASFSHGAITATVFIALGVCTCMLSTAPSWSACIDIGRENSGTVSAAMNTSGQIAAVASQPIIGYSLDWFHNWNVPFWLLAALFVMGAICWAFVEPTRPVTSSTVAAAG